MSIITRFAPSPTGRLHIGGARTALFNLLLASSNNDKFKLRIEDTDKVRSKNEYTNDILEQLKWLNLPWSDDVIYQSQNIKRHQQVANRLLKQGHAYKCFSTNEDVQQNKTTGKYNADKTYRKWRFLEKDEIPKLNQPYTVRLKAPLKGSTIIDDLVQKQVTFKNENLDDFVMLRTDGTPTYLLAVVVDDHDMGISHIIRGDDHLTNSARQKLLYTCLGWDCPKMAHLPLIHGSDGTKLSKRHGDLTVDYFRRQGYLPEALINYLVRLGWSHGDQEIFTLEEIKTLFSLEKIGKAAAKINFAKLEYLNSYYLKNKSPKAIFDDINKSKLIDPSLCSCHKKKQQFLAAIATLQPRAKTLLEIVNGTSFIFQKRPITIKPDAQEILQLAISHLKELKDILVSISKWESKNIEQIVRNYCNTNSHKLKNIAQPLRVAITGARISPPIFSVMEILEKDEVIKRLDDQIK